MHLIIDVELKYFKVYEPIKSIPALKWLNTL